MLLWNCLYKKNSVPRLEFYHGFKRTRTKTIFDSIDADILVFPELCTSGYFFLNRKETEKISESFAGKTVTLIQNKATDQNKIIVFGFAEKDENSIYNYILR